MNTTTANENTTSETQPEPRGNSDWLAERKREVKQAFEKKAQELSKRAQTRISSKMSHYDSTLSDVSTALEENEETHAASLTRHFAEKIRSGADYIENTPSEEIVSDSAEKVRGQPLIALGAAITAGYLLGRLLSAGKDQSGAISD